jgi:hypothetical protein
LCERNAHLHSMLPQGMPRTAPAAVWRAHVMTSMAVWRGRASAAGPPDGRPRQSHEPKQGRRCVRVMPFEANPTQTQSVESARLPGSRSGLARMLQLPPPSAPSNGGGGGCSSAARAAMASAIGRRGPVVDRRDLASRGSRFNRKTRGRRPDRVGEEYADGVSANPGR